MMPVPADQTGMRSREVAGTRIKWIFGGKNYLSCLKLSFVNHRFSITGCLLAGSFLMLTACNDPKNKSHGPIVLGDSSTIVTETDPVHLQDMVQDLRPAVEQSLDTTTAVAETKPPKDTVKPTAGTPPPQEKTPPATPPPGNGLNIAFKEVTVFIPNITTRSYGRQNLENARGASYELSTGNIAGNQLKILNGTVQKVTQRYQSVIALQDGNRTLQLESLGVHASDWQTLKGNGNSFSITGLESSRLDYIEAGAAAIKNAVTQATRKARMSKNEASEWQNLSRNVRSAEKAPCTILLRSVAWRIEGKDTKGKTFNKEIRIDLPK